MKHYIFLPEASSKMLLRHIREVENCASVIIDNYFKIVKNIPITILSLHLNSALSTEEDFFFSIHLFSEKYENDMFLNISIPVKAFDTCDEKWTSNIKEIFD